MKLQWGEFVKRPRIFIFIVSSIVISVIAFTALIIQQERILRKYFIIDPQQQMKEYRSSLSDSLAKYFIKENKYSTMDEVTDYIKKYGRTSLFEYIFLFQEKDGRVKQISNYGMKIVVNAVLSGEDVYPMTIDNGRMDGYLLVLLKDPGGAELREGLRKYNMISYSLRFMFLVLIAAFSVILLYHQYSAKMKLATHIAEMKASNDGLTGLHTHEYFMKILNIEVERFKIYHTPVALLILDVDNFKKLNDTFGHQSGDKVLADVAEIIRSSSRATDILSRYGGEEFAVIIPYVEKDGSIRDKDNLKNFILGVQKVAEKIRSNVDEYRSDILPPEVNVTISIGGAFYYHKSDSIISTDLLRRADMALYKAKRLGRNRVCLDYESASPF